MGEGRALRRQEEMIERAQEGLRAMTWAATAPPEERITVGPGASDEIYASFAEALGPAGQVRVEEQPDGSRLFRVRRERPLFLLVHRGHRLRSGIETHT